MKYLNLKHETALNSLTDGDIKTLWLPLILYDNTDQKEVTRLGVQWEWMTLVTVSREGNFTRSRVAKCHRSHKYMRVKKCKTWTKQASFYGGKGKCKFHDLLFVKT